MEARDTQCGRNNGQGDGQVLEQSKLEQEALAKRTSQKKIEANRRNARKSTGPKTRRGKARVRFNAAKHGFLSKQVVISNAYIQEDTHEFNALVDQLRHDLRPAGKLEELLVDKIAVCFWKTRRALRCEIGEVWKSLDQKDWYVDQSERNPKILEFMIWTVQQAASQMEKDSRLSDDTIENIKRWFKEYKLGSVPLSSNGLDVDDWREATVGLIEITLEHLQDLHQKDTLLKRERLALPPAEDLDRILRYDAMNERQLQRTLASLERRQRERKISGESVVVKEAGK